MRIVCVEEASEARLANPAGTANGPMRARFACSVVMAIAMLAAASAAKGSIPRPLWIAVTAAAVAARLASARGGSGSGGRFSAATTESMLPMLIWAEKLACDAIAATGAMLGSGGRGGTAIRARDWARFCSPSKHMQLIGFHPRHPAAGRTPRSCGGASLQVIS